MEDSNAAPRQQGAHASLFDKAVWIESVLADKSLNSSAKTVAMRLALHHNSTTGRCDPSIPTIAEGVDLSTRMVGKCLAALNEAGFVSWTPGKLNRNRYTLERIFIGQKSEQPSQVVAAESTEPEFQAVRNQSSTPVRNQSSNKPSNSNARTNSPSPPTPTWGPREVASRSGQIDEGRPTLRPENMILNQARANVARKYEIRADQDIREAWRAFGLHYDASGRKMLDWDAAWESWCLNRKKMKPAAQMSRPAI